MLLAFGLSAAVWVIPHLQLHLIGSIPAIMAFTLSLDDFVISYFTCGHYQTLPIVIYNMTKKTVAPDVYALSTIIFLCVFVLLILYNTLQSKADSRRGFNV